MRDNSDFQAWLFPGQYIPFEENPFPDFPEDVERVLDQIAAETKIPEDWLEKTAGLIVDGLAGLQCLWYLHGLSGTVRVTPTMPGWVSYVTGYAKSQIEKETLRRKNVVAADLRVSDVDWQKGTFAYTLIIEVLQGDGEVEEKVTQHNAKIGKWLEKWIAEMGDDLHFTRAQIGRMRSEMKKRAKLDVMEWRISAHPFDVLTMSYKRPWSSCMRPGSDFPYQYGILSDLAAGTAIMFFYRPGADVPAGRLTLRPALDHEGEPSIYSARTVYGTGPSRIRPEELRKMLKAAGAVADLPVYERDFCPAGHGGRALTRLIYSDFSHTGCTQTDEQYNSAFYKLGNSDWPPAQLDVGEMREIAEEYANQFECDIGEIRSQEIEIDAEEIVADLMSTHEYDDVFTLLGLLDDDESEANREVHEHLLREFDISGSILDVIDEETLSTLEWDYRSAIQNRCVELMQEEPSMLIAYRAPDDDLEGTDFIEGLEVYHIWKFKDASTYIDFNGKVRERPAMWVPETVPAEVRKALGLGGGDFGKKDKLYLPSDDPNQLELFPITKYAARTVIAIWLDDTTKERIEKEMADYEDEDETNGLPPFLFEASVVVTADPGVYDWEDFFMLRC